MHKNIGLYILGIGNGHITQAQVMYSILKKLGYQIPITVFISDEQKREWSKMFPDSEYLFLKTFVSANDINNLNDPMSIFKFTLSTLPTYQINKIIDTFELDLVLGFWTPSISVVPKKPVLCIASQYLLDIELLNYLNHMTKKHLIPVSIDGENQYSKLSLPPLINENYIKKISHDFKIIVAYAVSGSDFILTLNQIAKNNPEFIIHLFFKSENLADFVTHNSEFIFEDNIFYHNTSRKEFKNHLSNAKAVLSTSGNELIYECVLNQIPIAIMPCSKQHVEQCFNFKRYIENGYANEMNSELNLDLLINKEVNKIHKDLVSKLDNRDFKIKQLVEKFIN